MRKSYVKRVRYTDINGNIIADDLMTPNISSIAITFSEAVDEEALEDITLSQGNIGKRLYDNDTNVLTLMLEDFLPQQAEIALTIPESVFSDGETIYHFATTEGSVEFLDLRITSGDAEIADMSLAGKTIAVEADVINTLGVSEDVTVLYLCFNDDELVDVNYKPFSLDKIRYEIDMDNWNFNCYVNDTLLAGGPYTLHMTNKDNGVQSLFFYLNNSGEFYIDDIVVKHEETGSKINAGFALGDLKIEANNAEITDVVTDGNITVTIKALNETGYTKKVNLVYASYCGDKLVDVKVMPTDIAALPDVQKIISEEYTVKDGITITETKAFIWDNTASLTPLHPSVKYPK